MESCLLLNVDYTFLNIVDWKRALVLLYKNKVQVVKYSKKTIKSCNQTIVVPLVIRLMSSIKTLYKAKVPYSKRNIFTRDEGCAYCNSKTNLTIDHIKPKSKGGKTNFLNCVACCKPCNNKKGDRILEESGMLLKKEPYIPSVMEFLSKKIQQSDLKDVMLNLWST